jgi:putative ABC transport system permease protein
MNFITLGATDLALASLLVIINAGLSLMLGLRLERQLLIAAVRMVVQLSLMGLVLKLCSPWSRPYGQRWRH